MVRFPIFSMTCMAWDLPPLNMSEKFAEPIQGRPYVSLTQFLQVIATTSHSNKPARKLVTFFHNSKALIQNAISITHQAPHPRFETPCVSILLPWKLAALPSLDYSSMLQEPELGKRNEWMPFRTQQTSSGSSKSKLFKWKSGTNQARTMNR